MGRLQCLTKHFLVFDEAPFRRSERREPHAVENIVNVETPTLNCKVFYWVTSTAAANRQNVIPDRPNQHLIEKLPRPRELRILEELAAGRPLSLALGRTSPRDPPPAGRNRFRASRRSASARRASGPRGRPTLRSSTPGRAHGDSSSQNRPRGSIAIARLLPTLLWLLELPRDRRRRGSARGQFRVKRRRLRSRASLRRSPRSSV